MYTARPLVISDLILASQTVYNALFKKAPTFA